MLGGVTGARGCLAARASALQVDICSVRWPVDANGWVELHAAVPVLALRFASAQLLAKRGRHGPVVYCGARCGGLTSGSSTAPRF